MEKLSSLIKLSAEAEVEINCIISKIKQEIIDGAKASCFTGDRLVVERADILSVLHKLDLYRYADPYD